MVFLLLRTDVRGLVTVAAPGLGLVAPRSDVV